jgi:hypothetical protein
MTFPDSPIDHPRQRAEDEPPAAATAAYAYEEVIGATDLERALARMLADAQQFGVNPQIPEGATPRETTEEDAAEDEGVAERAEQPLVDDIVPPITTPRETATAIGGAVLAEATENSNGSDTPGEAGEEHAHTEPASADSIRESEELLEQSSAGDDGGDDGNDNGNRISEGDEGASRHEVRAYCINKVVTLLDDVREAAATQQLSIDQVLVAGVAIAQAATAAAADLNVVAVRACCEALGDIGATVGTTADAIAEAGLAEHEALDTDAVFLKSRLSEEKSRREATRVSGDTHEDTSPVLDAVIAQCARQDRDISPWIRYGVDEQERWLLQARYCAIRLNELRTQRRQGELSQADQGNLDDLEVQLLTQASEFHYSAFDPEFVVTHTSELLDDPMVAPIILQKFLDVAPYINPTSETLGALDDISKKVYSQFAQNAPQAARFYEVASVLCDKFIAAGGAEMYVRQFEGTLSMDILLSSMTGVLNTLQHMRPRIRADGQRLQLGLLQRIIGEIIERIPGDDSPLPGDEDLIITVTPRQEEADRLYLRSIHFFAARHLFSAVQRCITQLHDRDQVPIALRECWGSARTLEEFIPLRPDDETVRAHPELQLLYEFAQLRVALGSAPMGPPPQGRLRRIRLTGELPLYRYIEVPEGDESATESPGETEGAEEEVALTQDEIAALLTDRGLQIALQIIHHEQLDERLWELLMGVVDAVQLAPVSAYRLLQPLTYWFTREEAPNIPYGLGAPLFHYLVTNPQSQPIDYWRTRNWVDSITDPTDRLKALAELANWLDEAR